MSIACSKMRLTLGGVLAGALILCSASLWADNPAQQIALVDMETVFTKYYKTELADKQLKVLAEEYNSERKEMVSQYESLQQDFNSMRDEAQNVALSEDVRTRKKEELDEKVVELRDQERKIQRFQESHQKQLQEQSLRMRKRIVTEIHDEISTYAKSKGITLVLDSSGQSLNGVEVVLYATNQLDITADVIGVLNKGKQSDVKLDELTEEAPSTKGTNSLMLKAKPDDADKMIKKK